MFFFKIIALFFAFAAVIYVMKALNSGEGSNQVQTSDAMALLTGGDLKPMNWCPENTVRVELFAADGTRQKTYSEKAQISMLCELMIGGFSNEGISPTSYKKLLVASDGKDKERVLEVIPEQEIYRVQGMPFKSPMLRKAFERLDQK
jgi:hypothetical protein